MTYIQAEMVPARSANFFLQSGRCSRGLFSKIFQKNLDGRSYCQIFEGDGGHTGSLRE